MQQHLKIKAFFFLSVLSMLLFHQAVPHWHHKHQEELHDHDVVHHHHYDNHHNEHHHHSQPEPDDSKKGFLDWLLEMHTHTNTTTEVLVLKQSTVEKITIEKESVTAIFSSIVNLVFFEKDTSSKKWYNPPDKLKNTYYHHCTLRGPPSLG